ncbi:putative hydrolase rbbp9 [Actinomortierella ambigua]|nr:putative hydrolase rbbp9 [Actinomortierella ambigua]
MSRILLVPGNGNNRVETSMWYPSVVKRLAEAKDAQSGEPLFPGGYELRTFPDYLLAREHIWTKFMEEELRIGENDVVIGHSSGAAALLRYAETRKVKGIVLVSAYHSDLGDDIERASGYFNRPWKWDDIAKNAEWIVQFSSPSDHLVPIDEQRFVSRQLNGVDYIELPGRGHFISDRTFPELVEKVKEHMK